MMKSIHLSVSRSVGRWSVGRSRLPMQFLWENDSATKFKDILRSPDLQMLIRGYSEDDIHNEDVNTSLGKVENMLISAAKRCLKIGIRKNRKK